MNNPTTLATFEALKKENNFAGRDGILTDFYDTLDPMPVGPALFSRWHGGDFFTNHWCNPGLKDMLWYGKWYRAQMDALPLVCYNQVNQLYANVDSGGEASLWDINFRGKVSACMVYDGQAVFDHLRKVDDNNLMGIMVGKAINGMAVNPGGKYYYFYLERIEQFPTDFVYPDGQLTR